MNNITKLLIPSLCFILLMAFTTSALAAPPIRVTFIMPSPRTHFFWDNYASFMESAALDLGVELNVLESNDRYQVLDFARRELSKKAKPDYLIFQYNAQFSLSILEMAEAAGVKSLIVNNDVVPTEKDKAGIPRVRYKQWIGYIYPDDTKAGYQLTAELLKKGDALGLEGQDGLLHVIGAGGNKVSTSSIYRKQGLFKAIDDDPKSRLDRFLLCGWDGENARKKTDILIDLYPQAKIFWAINDHNAFGMLDVIRKHNLKPGRDAIVGCFNWSPEVFDAIKNSDLEAASGGHFIEGAWALVLLYDYHHGIDFSPSGTAIKSHMRILDSSNIDTYSPILEVKNWEKIDFKRFTKTHNPSIKEYDFSPDALIQEMASMKKS